MDNEKNLKMKGFDATLIDGIGKKYAISDEEMGQILGFGASKGDQVVALKQNPALITPEISKRAKFALEIFSSLRIFIEEGKIPSWIRTEEVASLKDDVPGEKRSFTMLDLMCEASNEASYVAKKYLLDHTGGVWSSDYGPDDPDVKQKYTLH